MVREPARGPGPMPGNRDRPGHGLHKGYDFLLTFQTPYQPIIIPANPTNQELNKNIKLVTFIYKRINIDCLAEHDIRGLSLDNRDGDQV
jgi:hypothetical protein